MANPIRDEDKLYQILKDEGVKVHPIIWQLLDHHIRNDLFGISSVVEDAFDRKEPLLEKEINSVIKRIKSIIAMLKKLQEATDWDGKYYTSLEKNKE